MTIRRVDRIGYSDLVCDFFSEIRGQGLMLSPLDQSLVESWEKEGIPVEVVCRGIVLGKESHERSRPGVRLPQRLSYYAPAVAEAWRAHKERAVGGRRREEK